MQNLKISLVQTDIIWENIDANIEILSKKLDGLTEETDIIILPETFNTGFTNKVRELAEPLNGKTMRWMKDTAQKKNAVITGSIFIKEGDNFYNRLIWYQPNGDFHYYDKRHLFRLENENLYIKQGQRRLVINYKCWKILPLICYDIRFPIWCANKYSSRYDLYNYDIIIHVSNWPEKRIETWKTLLKARAIENQAYIIGVNRIGIDNNDINYSGESTIIDYKGNSITTISKNEENIVSTSISYDKLEEYRKYFFVGKDWDKYHIYHFGKDIKLDDVSISEKVENTSKHKKRSFIHKIKKLKKTFIITLLIILFLSILSIIYFYVNNTYSFKESEQMINEKNKVRKAVYKY